MMQCFLNPGVDINVADRWWLVECRNFGGEWLFIRIFFRLRVGLGLRLRCSINSINIVCYRGVIVFLKRYPKVFVVLGLLFRRRTMRLMYIIAKSRGR
jgi:hypothetical protein